MSNLRALLNRLVGRARQVRLPELTDRMTLPMKKLAGWLRSIKLPGWLQLPKFLSGRWGAKSDGQVLSSQPQVSLTARAGDLFASLLAMLVVVYKRLRHNAGISISALIGIVAVMAMVICVPVFSHAVSSKVLREQLTEKAQANNRGLFSLHMYYLDKRSASPLKVNNVEQFTGYIKQSIADNLGLRTKLIDVEVQSGNYGWVSDKPRGTGSPTEAWMTMSFQATDAVRNNGDILEGSWPQTTAGGPVQVAVMQRTADEYFLNVGDRFHYQTLEIEITGIWAPKTPKEGEPEIFWFENPTSAYKDILWVPLETYRTRLDPIIERSIFYVSWYIVVDENSLRLDRAADYARGLVQVDTQLRTLLPGAENDYSPLEALNGYRERANTLTTLFYAVSGPMIVLALLFISLTATIAAQQYEQEVATMRGRGTSWLQVAALNLIESVALILIALPLALLFGWLAAVMMGQTQSFLRFTSRSDIIVTLQGINLLWLAIAALLIVVSRFLPILNLSRTSIVQVKQERSRATRKPIWQRFYLDFLLLLPGIYAYVTQSGMAKPIKFLSALTPSSESAYKDPLLFVAPSLFAMGLCMIMLRILPLILKGLALAVENLPRVWAYLSLQQVARRPQDHSAALLLIMISLSLAIYSASTAKTLDKWLHDSAYYASGADFVVHEYILPAQTSTGSGPSTSSATSKMDLSVEGYFDVNQHLDLPAVNNVTRVGRYEGTFSYGVGELPASFMGIDRLEFPNVAFYRNDFAGQSLGALMNELAQDPMGVLVQNSILDEIGLKVGDRINADIRVIDQNTSLELVILGTYDYFPTIYPSKKPTFILNLETLFDDPEGVVGYDVWLNLRPDTDMELLQDQMRGLISQDRAVIEVKGNAYEDVQKMIDQPERVGLFGVLNVGFIATGLMPGIGFVLYSYASMRRRFIQLGILQAIGLSVKQLIGYLALEQFLLMGIAIGCGAAIGLVTSNMFVPFLQLGASGAAPVPPFEVLIGWGESAWLSVAFGLVLFLTMLGTIWYLAHMKVFQAVKMGEAM